MPPTNLNLPVELLSALDSRAVSERRSRSAMAALLLEGALAEPSVTGAGRKAGSDSGAGLGSASAPEPKGSEKLSLPTSLQPSSGAATSAVDMSKASPRPADTEPGSAAPDLPWLPSETDLGGPALSDDMTAKLGLKRAVDVPTPDLAGKYKPDPRKADQAGRKTKP